jgi:membrane protein implicated in regulation of membrane protease activity
MFGWTGLAMLRNGQGMAFSFTLAFWAGVVSMLLTAYAFVWMLKLQHSGNVDIRNAINHSGNVYIRVPPGRKIGGKITMVLQGKFSEMEAVTDDADEIKVGEEVTVIGIAGPETLIVTKRRIKITEMGVVENDKHWN